MRTLLIAGLLALAWAAGAADSVTFVKGADPVVACLDPSPGVSDAAIADLAADAQRGRALVESWLVAKDPRQRAVAVRVGVAMRGMKSLPTLAALVQDKEATVRRALALALEPLPFVDERDRDSRALLELEARLLADGDYHVRLSAVRKLARCDGSSAATKALLAATTDVPEEVADRAVEALLARQAPKLVETISAHLGDVAIRNRVLAANGLGRIGGDASVKLLLKGLGACSGDGPMWEARSAICDAIAQAPPQDAALTTQVEKALLPLLFDKAWGVRASSAWALGRIGSAKVLPALVQGIDPLDGEPFRGVLRGLTDQPWSTVDEWRTWWKKGGDKAAPKPLAEPPAESTIEYWSIPETTTNVVFVIDHSGSMAETGAISQYHVKDKIQRSKLEMAGRELLRTALTLTPATRFNVVQFSGAAEAWNDGPIKATWRAKAKLKAWVDGLGAGGGTNADEGLQLGLDQVGVDTVFFLTDGLPTTGETDTQHIIQHVHEANARLPRPARIHTVAFFVEEAKGFLSGLASANDGQYRVIE
jgi:HEAT repeat protein